MPMHHAQRQHIINSVRFTDYTAMVCQLTLLYLYQIERILYQLYTISFFLSPALAPYLCRTVFQFQFAKPRDIDPRLSLRFWFILILLFNATSIWTHATDGPAKGRSIILDFVGPGASAVRCLRMPLMIRPITNSITSHKIPPFVLGFHHYHTQHGAHDNCVRNIAPVRNVKGHPRPFIAHVTTIYACFSGAVRRRQIRVVLRATAHP